MTENPLKIGLAQCRERWELSQAFEALLTPATTSNQRIPKRILEIAAQML